MFNLENSGSMRAAARLSVPAATSSLGRRRWRSCAIWQEIRGRTVSKEELFQEVWPGISVTDDFLVQCIHDIREVLEDGGHRIVKTVPRRGYLFSGLIAHDQRQAAPSRNHGARRRRRLPPCTALPDRPSIAILPFASLSGDPEQDYFSDGIVEDITTALSRNRAFLVIARNSSFTYKGKGIDIKQLGASLAFVTCSKGVCASREPRSRHRAVDRGAIRPPSLGRSVRWRYSRYF